MSNKARSLNLTFSAPKTDLIHWRTPRDKTPRCILPVTVGDSIIHPSKSVKWLGYWLQDNHSTHQHFTKRLHLAKAAWVKVRRLSDAGKGLNPRATRHLSQVLIRPTLLYGSEIFSPPGHTLRAMSTFWRKIAIWVTNCFHSTSSAAVHSESFLTPLPPLINFIQSKYAIRIVGIHPFINPASARLPPSAPIHWSPKPPKRTFPFKNRRGIYAPRAWNSTSKHQSSTHLPVDKVLSRIVHLTHIKPFLPRNYKAPLPPGIDAPNLHREAFTPNQVSDLLQADLLSEWSELYPSSSYKYPIPGKPHTFMRLGKFQASRIHQMRAGQSYLAAQPTYRQRDQSTLCPACESEEETFEHAALDCPARDPMRQTHCPGLSSISHNSPLWSSFEDIRQFSRFISHARINFPTRN